MPTRKESRHRRLGRPPIAARDKLDKPLTIPLTARQHAALRQAAEDAGLRSAAAYARSLLLVHLRELGLLPRAKPRHQPVEPGDRG